MAAVFCLQCDRTSLWLRRCALVASWQPAVYVPRTFVVNRRNFSMDFFLLKLIFIIIVFIIGFCFASCTLQCQLKCCWIFYFLCIYIISYFFYFCLCVYVCLYSRHFVALVYLCSSLLCALVYEHTDFVVAVADTRRYCCCSHDAAALNVVSHNWQMWLSVAVQNNFLLENVSIFAV